MWKALLGGLPLAFWMLAGRWTPLQRDGPAVGAAFLEVMRKEAGPRCPSAGTGARGTGDGAGLRC